MGQEIPEQKADETSTSTSINPTAQQDGAPVPLRDDTQSMVPEAVEAGRDVQSLKSSSAGPRFEADFTTSQLSEGSSSPEPHSKEASSGSPPLDVIPANA